MKWTCQDCKQLVKGLKAEHCPVCCETFGGIQAGDKHRVGHFSPYERRCLTPAEMEARGLWHDDDGVWHLPAPRMALRSHSAENLRP
jgi:hypothetical protein